MEGKTWLGTSMDDMGRGNGSFNFDVPPISPSKYHSVLYELPVNLLTPPKPHHSSQTRHWENDYVRMPFSPNNLFPVRDQNGEEQLKCRWEIIQAAVLQPISSSMELESAINCYNTRLPKFLALHHFFEEVLGEEESEAFFKTLLPGIVQLALQLPDLLPGNLPLLKKETCRSVSLSQLQIASLLANGFLCTFPWRKDVSGSYPGVNFTRLFAAYLRPKRKNCVAEKLKCIFHYFHRVLSKAPIGVITFERKFLHKNQVPRWDRLENNLGNTRIHVSSAGTIEDSGHWLLQVDFANKYVGGGVLGYGCVQEEIRYVICPELIVSRLFVEELSPREAVVVTGVERYSNYSGYGDSFVWSGDHRDDAPYDIFGRKKTTVVAIDALRFNRPTDQFHTSSILRELNKAYVGFHSRLDGKLSPVATGNWGCGAFRGDPKLKSVIQLMACSAANRNMVYYTFGDTELQDRIYNIYTFLATNKVTVYQLWRLLCRFVAAQLKPDNFFPYIQQAYFDSKKQPSVKQMYSFNKNNVQQQATYKALGRSLEEGPSTSSSNTNSANEKSGMSISENLDDTDIIESSQPAVIESSQSKEIFKYYKFKKHKLGKVDVREKQDDVIGLINIIDGDEALRVNETSSVDTCTGVSEDMGSDINCKSEFVSIDMDVECLSEDFLKQDDTAENVQHKLPPENSNAKRKITDYFVKASK